MLSLSIVFAQGSRDERWRQDIDQLARTVTTNHPNFFTQVSRDVFQQEVAALLGSVTDKTDAEIVVGMQRLLAMGGDGHTAMSLFQPRSPVRQVPLRLYWFSDGIFATDAAAAYVKVLGKKLVQIEGIPVEEAINRVTPLISHENEWWVQNQVPALLTSPDVLGVAGIAARGAATIRYTFVNSDGDTANVALPSAALPLVSLPQKAHPNPPLYRRYPERFYWFEYLDASGTVYVKYNVCQESPVLGMQQFLLDAQAYVQNMALQRFVIDLRNNGGGNSAVIAPLLGALVQAIAAGEISADRIFAIIGRETFSSGNWAAMDFKRMGATLVGEPTGNRPNSFGQVQPFTLANSQLGAQYSTRLWEFKDFTDDAVMPDVKVLVSSADFFDERDPVLESIVK